MYPAQIRSAKDASMRDKLDYDSTAMTIDINRIYDTTKILAEEEYSDLQFRRSQLQEEVLFRPISSLSKYNVNLINIQQEEKIGRAHV